MKTFCEAVTFITFYMKVLKKSYKVLRSSKDFYRGRNSSRTKIREILK